MELRLSETPAATTACLLGHRLLMIARTVNNVAEEEVASKTAPQAVTVGFVTSEVTGDGALRHVAFMYRGPLHPR